MSCPDENALAELARNELPVADRAAIEAHLDTCDACSEVVAELMRLFESSFSSGELPEAEAEAAEAEDDASCDHSGPEFESTRGYGEEDDAWPTDLALPEGAKLGRYVVLRAIGAGAMGVVYAAYDPELDRKVAIKLLRRGPERDPLDAAASQSTRNKRLLREAQALARLAHPHVIAVHDVGMWEGQVFLAMEFVENGTLTEWLTEHPRPWREVLRVFQQAGEGLAAAHEAGLVHRDFKPDNVLLRGDGRVVVTDFGLARPTARALDEDTSVSTPEREPVPAALIGSGASGSPLSETLTRTGVLVGTPAYMAPEQLDAKRGDAQSDQFGFCVALYEGLYGERPFQARNLTGLITAVYAGQVRPAPPGRTVPRWLRRVVLRGLRVEAGERYPSMRALLSALRPRRLGAWGGVIAIGVIGAAAGATAVALSAAPAEDPARYCDDVASKLEGVWDEPARAELRAAFGDTQLWFAEDAAARVIASLDARAEQWVEVQTEACLRGVEGREPAAVVDLRMMCLAQHRGTLEAMAGVLRHADADTVMSAVDAVHAPSSPRECLEASALAGSLPPVPEAEQAAVMAVRTLLAESHALGDLGKLVEARAKVEAARAGAAELGYGPLQAEIALALATALDRAGEIGPAETEHHRAVAAGVAHDHDEIVAMAAVGLAQHERAGMGAPVAMERWVSLGLAALESLGGSRPQLRASLLAARGDAQRQAGELDEAIATLQEVLAIREQVGTDHSSVAEPLTALGLTYARKGMRAESVRHIERAREILRATYGEEHPNYAISLQNLATTHFLSGHYADALALYHESHRLLAAGLGARHPSVAVLAYNVGTTLAFLERYDEALTFVQQAQDLEQGAYGARSRTMATSWALVGEIQLRAGRLPEAESALREALSILEQVAPDDRRAHANYDGQLGYVLLLAGRIPEADALLTTTLELQRELAGEPSVEVAETSGRLAMVRLAAGRLDEAKALIEASVAQYESEDPDPHQHAEARFRRARILAARGEPLAARAAAERARSAYAELGDQPSRLGAVEQWLAEP